MDARKKHAPVKLANLFSISPNTKKLAQHFGLE